MNAERLLEIYEQISEAPDAIARLRRFVLDLAVRGKLVEQDAGDEPAAELLKRVAAEKARLVKAGEIKKPKALEPVDEAPFEVPCSWQWTRLGELAELVRGISFPASAKSTEPGAGRIPCFRSGNIQAQTVWDDFIYVPEDTLKSSGQMVRPGDVLISIANSYALVGKCSIVNEAPYPATFGAFLAAIRLHLILPKYAKAFLISDYSATAFRVGSSQTTNIANITFSTIRGHPFAIPPLGEQHRIVAKVDELMALCDRLEEARKTREEVRDKLTAASLARLTAPETTAEDFPNHAAFALEALPALTTRPDQIKPLRQTILNLAVRGKLVEQDPADEPATEVLKRIAAERERLVKSGEIKKQKALSPIGDEETSFPLPSGWSWVRLGDLSQFVTSGSRDWAKFYAKEGAIFVRMGNLSKDHYRLRLDNIQRVKPPATGEGTRTRLEGGDVLISITGDVGMLGLIPEDFGEAYINQHTAMVRPMPEMKGRYLPELFRSPFAQDQFNAPQRGIKNSFRLTDVTQFVVPLPPLAEQHRIVAKVDALMALCDRLKAALTTTDTTRTRLLEALLHEALEPAVQTLEAAQ